MWILNESPRCCIFIYIYIYEITVWFMIFASYIQIRYNQVLVIQTLLCPILTVTSIFSPLYVSNKNIFITQTSERGISSTCRIINQEYFRNMSLRVPRSNELPRHKNLINIHANGLCHSDEMDPQMGICITSDDNKLIIFWCHLGYPVSPIGTTQSYAHNPHNK